MDLAIFLNVVSGVFAILAAIFWFWSARWVPLPEKITLGFGGEGGTAPILGDALHRQARLSAYGAIMCGRLRDRRSLLLGRGLMV